MTTANRGLQVVEKVGALLRALGSAGRAGLTTSEAARRTGLPRPTTHRLLTALAAQGLVDRQLATGDWHIGPELYLLGGAAASRYDVTAHARDILAGIAAQTEESAYFSAARGYESVCLLEEEGSFPLRSHVLHIGIRFPLGVASAGLAMLAHLPPAEADAYLARVDLTRAWGRAHSRAAVRDRVIAGRELGYVVNPGLIVEGSWGIGAAVFDSTGRPAWALSVTGVESRLRPPRQQEIGHLLLQHAHRLSQRLARRNGLAT
ncbi:MAG TPA: IclR family transcriptional regulator [Acidothermaceae bacterium]|nr:IclR family transcriptional regulator [Acidothermaceae bacterium]